MALDFSVLNPSRTVPGRRAVGDAPRRVNYTTDATECQTVTLLIPTLNEIDGMKAIMPRIDRAWVDQIVILDGGSTDGTAEWARDHGYFVHVQRQPGIRQAYMEVLPRIEGDVILTFSPDGNSIPALIPAVIA
jgi:glycosyltransferase involved in cell wall biosynthesis